MAMALASTTWRSETLVSVETCLETADLETSTSAFAWIFAARSRSHPSRFARLPIEVCVVPCSPAIWRKVFTPAR